MSTQPFRVATLNLEQNHKRWDLRRELVIDQLVALQPDVMACNESCLPLQTGRWLQRRARERLGRSFALVQQSKTNDSSLVEGEALLTRYPVLETANCSELRISVAPLDNIADFQLTLLENITRTLLTLGENRLTLTKNSLITSIPAHVR
jgi:hypothetical protein